MKQGRERDGESLERESQENVEREKEGKFREREIERSRDQEINSLGVSKREPRVRGSRDQTQRTIEPGQWNQKSAPRQAGNQERKQNRTTNMDESTNLHPLQRPGNDAWEFGVHGEIVIFLRQPPNVAHFFV